MIKQGAILESLQDEIVSGKLKPGGRMPTRDELEKHFGVSRVTLQRAFDRLMRDGFIVSKGNRGTFVSETPPHLSSYALVFPFTPDDPSWSRFWTALSDEAVTLARTSRIKISCYYEVNGSTDCEDYQRLLHEVRARRLAGMIFSSMSESLLNTPLMEESGTPRVAIMLPRPGCQMPAVYPDLCSFMDLALDSLLARGRRRVALVGNINNVLWTQMVEYLVEGMKARGMEFRPYWAQLVDCSSALRTVHLLMHNEQKTRPDGLIIADDNLVEHSTAGLLAAGVRVPEDAEVVAHCNFPWPAPSVVPVQRLGFDARQVMAACVESIDMQRRGETPPAFVSIRALFENEVGVPAGGRDEIGVRPGRLKV